MPAWSLCCSRGRYLSCQRWTSDFLSANFTFFDIFLVHRTDSKTSRGLHFSTVTFKSHLVFRFCGCRKNLQLRWRLCLFGWHHWSCKSLTCPCLSFWSLPNLADILLWRSVVTDGCWSDLIVGRQMLEMLEFSQAQMSKKKLPGVLLIS